MRFVDFKVIESDLSGNKNDKYIAIVNKLLKDQVPLKIGKSGEKGNLFPLPNQHIFSRADSIEGYIVQDRNQTLNLAYLPNNPAEIETFLKNLLPKDLMQVIDANIPTASDLAQKELKNRKVVVKVSSLFKNEEMIAMARGLDPSTSATKIANRGNTAEGVLGAATLARLIKRPGDDIDINDLKNIIDRFPPPENNTGGTIKLSAKETENPIVDKFELTVKLPIKNYNDFKNVDKMLSDSVMAGIIKNILRYTNTTNTDRYAKMFELNGRPDEVSVISDGVSDVSGRKTDVMMIYNNEKGKKITKHLDLSLKVGSVKQFGQVGAGSGTEPDDDSFDILKNMFIKFGVDIEPVRKDYKQSVDRYSAYLKAYKLAAKLLQQELAGSNDDKEKVFLKKFVNAIQFFGTRNEPNVKLLQFEENKFFLLDFKKAERLFQQDKIDLDATIKIGNTSEGFMIPSIVIFNSVTKKSFLTIRVKVESGTDYLRNYIEKEPELKKILIVRQG